MSFKGVIQKGTPNDFFFFLIFEETPSKVDTSYIHYKAKKNRKRKIPK